MAAPGWLRKWRTARSLEEHAGALVRAEWVNSLQRIIEESSECLVAVDEEGRVREASRVARSFLHLHPGSAEILLFEDLFSSHARQAVIEWRERFVKHNSELAPGAKRALAPFQAVLATGTVVRLQLRSAIDADGDEVRRWLIYFENHTSRMALRETEERLEAGMRGLMDTIDSGVLLFDAVGNIRLVSNRLTQIMGLEARSLLEQGTIDALIESLAGRFSHPAGARTSGQPWPDPHPHAAACRRAHQNGDCRRWPRDFN
jgi:PAS domain-containing protein